MSSTKNNDDRVAWIYQHIWGFSSVPGMEDNRDELMRGYARSLCNAVAGDGAASPREISWIKGYIANKGFGILVDEVDAMAKEAEEKTLEQVAADTKEALTLNSGTLVFAGRAIIFDAFRASMADGLDHKEKHVIVTIAAEFDIDAAMVDEIQKLAEEEEAFRAKKAKLITPGHPNLETKYQ